MGLTREKITGKTYFWERILQKQKHGPGEGYKNGIPVKTGKIPCLHLRDILSLIRFKELHMHLVM